MVLALNSLDIYFLAKFIEAFLFGVYSGVFALYLHYTAKKGEKATALFYALSALYILSGAALILDVLITVYSSVPNFLDYLTIQFRISILETVVFGICDFISQSILIYRCWMMWNSDIRVVIFPIILALAYIALWMTSVGGTYIEAGGVYSTDWSVNGFTAALVLSLSLNALVTGLIAFRIFMVVKGNTTLYESLNSLSIAGGSQVKFRYIMFVVIESGMILFSIQLARAVVTTLVTEGPAGASDSVLDAFNLIVGIHEMLNGITPTIILVRVSMGLSFDDETSWREGAHSLQFADSIPGLRSIDSDKENDSSICDHDDIQTRMSEGPSASETIDKSTDSKESYIQKEGDSVELV